VIFKNVVNLNHEPSTMRGIFNDNTCNCCRSVSKTDMEEKTLEAVMSPFMTRVCEDRRMFK
jgi:hypothetical protein